MVIKRENTQTCSATYGTRKHSWISPSPTRDVTKAKQGLLAANVTHVFDMCSMYILRRPNINAWFLV